MKSLRVHRLFDGCLLDWESAVSPFYLRNAGGSTLSMLSSLALPVPPVIYELCKVFNASSNLQCHKELCFLKYAWHMPHLNVSVLV